MNDIDMNNLTDPPETEGNPWSDLLWRNGECAVSSYAAHDAILSLAKAWADDGGENRRFVIYTLAETIQALTAYHDALALTFEYEALHERSTQIADGMRAGTTTAAEASQLAKELAGIESRRQARGFTKDSLAKLIASAFSPKA